MVMRTRTANQQKELVMVRKKIMRRDFLKAALAGIPVLALDWDSFPRGEQSAAAKDTWDAVVIGSGLGGLSCAAAFARQGFKALVLEQHSVPGGYATTFKRPGGFEFDVSLPRRFLWSLRRPRISQFGGRLLQFPVGALRLRSGKG